MKSIITGLLLMGITLIGFRAEAQDYLQEYVQLQEQYYQYMYDQKVEVTQNKVTIKFRWSRTDMFLPGDAFELSVVINPKYFAKPLSGFDHVLDEDIDTNFECGYRDVFNYDIPGDKDYLYNTIIEQCEEHRGSLTDEQKDLIWWVSRVYGEDAEDSDANFGVGSTCPENFIPHKEYYFEYFLKPVPDDEIPDSHDPGEGECPAYSYDLTVHPDWGYFWINGEIHPDTFIGKGGPGKQHFEGIEVSDCPYIIGVVDSPYSYGNIGTTAVLFNRACAPTSEIKWGFPDPEFNGWRNVGLGLNLSCRDCDDDGLYDTDFLAEMYGEKTKDCNDRCDTVNTLPQEGMYDLLFDPDTFCSYSCGGYGCYDIPSYVYTCPDDLNVECHSLSPCIAGMIAVEDCSTKCSHARRYRECLDNCTWGGWGDCIGYGFNLGCFLGGGGGNPDPCDNPECTPGVTKNQPCGNGGTQTAICTDECDWGSWGDCKGSGPCNPGQTADCGYCGTMTCDANNQWDSCQNQGVCQPGQSKQQPCGNGIQTATCTSSCQWGSWSQCSCVCSSGTCCDGCNYKSSSVVCDSWYDYRCEGFNPGDDVERRELEQRCSGTSTNCNGQTGQGGWQTYQNCTSSQLCDDNYSPPQCVSCTDTYIASTSQACFTNNQQENITLCLQVQQVSGANWEYKICRSGGSYSSSYAYTLEDINYSVQFNDYIANQAYTCSPFWKPFTVSYISGYGASNGAGITGEVIYPVGCSQSSCRYKTGIITIRKECQ